MDGRKSLFSVGKCLNPLCGAATLNQYIHYCDRWACRLLRGVELACRAYDNDLETLEAAHLADLANNAETEDEEEEFMAYAPSSSKKRPLDVTAKPEPIKTMPEEAPSLVPPPLPQMPADDQYKIPKKKRDVEIDNVPIPKRKREDIPRRPDPPRPQTATPSNVRRQSSPAVPPPSNPFAVPSTPFERRGSTSRFGSGKPDAGKKDIVFQPGPTQRHKHAAKASPPIDPSVPRRVSFHSEWIQPASTNLRRVVDPVPILKVAATDHSSTKSTADRSAASGERASDRPASSERHPDRSASSKNQTISMTEYKKARQTSAKDDEDEAANKAAKERPTDPRRTMKRPEPAQATAPPTPTPTPAPRPTPSAPPATTPPTPTTTPATPAATPATPAATSVELPDKPSSSTSNSQEKPLPAPPSDPRKKYQPTPTPPPTTTATPSDAPAPPSAAPVNRPHDPRSRPPAPAPLPNTSPPTNPSPQPPADLPVDNSHDVDMDVSDDDSSWIMEAPPSMYAAGAPPTSASARPTDDDDEMDGVHDAGGAFGYDDDETDEAGATPVRSTPFHPLEGEYVDEEYGEDADPDEDAAELDEWAPLALAPADLYNVVWLLSGRMHSALVSMKLPLTKKADSLDHFKSLVRDVEAIRDAPMRVTIDLQDRTRGHDTRTQVNVRFGGHTVLHYLDKGSKYTALHAVLPALYTQCWVWHMIVNNVQTGLYSSLDQVLKKSRYYEFHGAVDEGSRTLDDGSVAYHKCVFRLQLGEGVHERDVEAAKAACYENAWTALQAMCSRITFMYRPLEESAAPAAASDPDAAVTSSMADLKVDGSDDIPLPAADLAAHVALIERDADSPGSSPIYAHPTVVGRLPDQFSDDDDDIYS